jgi:hypothetical protein
VAAVAHQGLSDLLVNPRRSSHPEPRGRGQGYNHRWSLNTWRNGSLIVHMLLTNKHAALRMREHTPKLTLHQEATTPGQCTADSDG